ncbi:MAG TPA: carboxypeptidase regulatory-like domain-containing protein [Acidobacteriota bacterium]
MLRAFAALGVGLLLCVPLSAYTAGPVQGGGRINGKVSLSGPAPTPAKIPVTKDAAVCGKIEHVDESVLATGGGLKNVVVSITKIDKGKGFAAPGAKLDQNGCRFDPHVVLLPAGGELEIINSDGILHNIHTFSTKNPAINKAQPKFKKVMKEKFAQVEVAPPVKVVCDAHSWMGGYLFVLDHPYYAVTADDGSYTLGDVPPGTYELRFWHEKFGEKKANVTVKGGAAAKVDQSYAAK